MDIKEFFSSDNKKHWIDKMKDCDWGAGQRESGVSGWPVLFS